MEVFGLFAVVIVIAIVLRLVAGGMDGDRVGEYIRGQGGELIESQWSPFGRGWFGEKNDRIYDVRYRDRDGNIHQATVKTSMMAGVYFTEDRIIERAHKSDAKESESSASELAAENARLRARIAELENGD